ncbi:MAG: UPF0182 family protein [Thaumarchaeota archaeon]|nr:UPF0182 family protein [Candidatus Geocrenenecus arthurdayi]MCL7390730.1 UPF0182 family protein [Candidatus Geocrenenecus arthurdayi]
MYTRSRRRPRATVVALTVFIIILFLISLSQILQVMLNFWEFGDLFVKPYYYSLIGGFILSFTAFFRLDFKNRNSITFWSFRLFYSIFWERYIRPRDLDFSSFRLSFSRFLAWQVTKTLIGTVFFANAFFGMAVLGILNGVDFGLAKIPELFKLPFTSMSIADTSPAQIVVSASPALILLIPPLLTSISVRLIILVGLTIILKASSRILVDYVDTGTFRLPIEAIELVLAIATTWIGFTLFLPNYIDYNTKVLILGSFSLTGLMLLFMYLDKTKPGFLYAYVIKGGAILLAILAIISIVTVQNSIADARKVEWLGPYVKQEIAVNRYLADIEDIRRERYIFPEHSSSLTIQEYIKNVKEQLDVIRLWDWEAAFTKMKPEIGLIPYVDFEDSDILRFNGRLYWSASMKPILPISVKAADVWYNQHLVYTHVPNGFLLLDASNGTIVDSSRFFSQRRIYYGEGGLLESTWAAIILGKDISDEVTGTRYSGRGGITVSPPISWIYDPTFFFSYPDKTIRLLRYRDVYDRMTLLFPYFEYRWNGELVDMFPVTDGERTYWLMPLIVRLSGEHVPWSRGNDYVRFIGYALIDVYDGSIQLIITGSDFISQIIKDAYKEVVIRDVPLWLYNQTRFPQELFEYQVGIFNNYHMDDVSIFIQAREFYEIPRGLYTYYIITKLQGFEKQEFVGILSLQIRGSPGRNLAGFMIVRNDYPHLGEKIFYYVPQESEQKLLGPAAAREALERYPEFRKLQTLLENPRIGETILYNIGEHLVYVIPVYTTPTGAGGVITQLGTIAIVGAEFTGSYFVSIGNSIEEAFESFLKALRGVPTTPKPIIDIMNLTLQVIEGEGLTPIFPEKINAHLVFNEGNISYTTIEQFTSGLREFLKKWVIGAGKDKVIIWREDNVLKVGVLILDEGIVELHYIVLRGG